MNHTTGARGSEQEEQLGRVVESLDTLKDEIRALSSQLDSAMTAADREVPMDE